MTDKAKRKITFIAIDGRAIKISIVKRTTRFLKIFQIITDKMAVQLFLKE